MGLYQPTTFRISTEDFSSESGNVDLVLMKVVKFGHSLSFSKEFPGAFYF
jgi:hypothetical protein